MLNRDGNGLCFAYREEGIAPRRVSSFFVSSPILSRRRLDVYHLALCHFDMWRLRRTLTYLLGIFHT